MDLLILDLGHTVACQGAAPLLCTAAALLIRNRLLVRPFVIPGANVLQHLVPDIKVLDLGKAVDLKE